MTPEENSFAEKVRKAYVALIAAESYLFQVSHSSAADYEDEDLLKDAWRLAEISANTCLRILEKKGMLIEQEPQKE